MTAAPGQAQSGGGAEGRAEAHGILATAIRPGGEAAGRALPLVAAFV